MPGKHPVLPFGSISHGTLITGDLINAFYDLLEETSETYAQSIRDNYYQNDRILLELRWCHDIPIEMEDDAQDLLESVMNALQEFCPPFCCFGAHPGDASDYGVWFNGEEFDDACRSGEVVMLMDGPPIEIDGINCPDAYYFAAVTDHGNLTVWSPDGSTVLEMV